jgi:predicted RND superfamily exporter protein
VNRLLIRCRYPSSAALLLALVLLLAFGRRVTYDQSLTSFFPDGDPAVVDYQRASDLFGTDNIVFLVYDDPDLLTPTGMDRVEELADSVRPDHIPAVLTVESLATAPEFWRLDDELIRIEGLPSLLRSAAVSVARRLVAGTEAGGRGLTIGAAIRQASPRDLLQLRGRIVSHPLLRNILVDPAGTSTVVVVHLKGMGEQDVKATTLALRTAADGFAARHGLKRPALVGPPILLADGFAYIEEDGRRLAVAGMTLIGLVTLSATHSLWWAVVPIVAGWVVWLAAETILAVLDLKLSLSGGPLVAQIICLTMPAASHLAIHFRDDLRHSADRGTAARATLAAVTRPILWCAVTGALGYGALITSDVVPVKQFGAVLAVCTLVAAILTLAVSPVAMQPPFALERAVRPGSVSRVASGVSGLTAWVDRHPLAIVGGVASLVAVFGVGAIWLRYESNYINAFRPDSRVVRDYRQVESRLGGIGLISVVVPVGPKIDLATLARLRVLEDEIRRAEGGGVVSGVISLASVLDPEGRLAALPAAQGEHALATKLDLIAAAPQGRLMGNFWNARERWSRALVRIPEQQPAGIKEATFHDARDHARELFGTRTFLTGLSYLLTQTTRGVMATSWSTFLWATASILLMLALAYRSPALAVLAILPSLLAVGLVLGLMGWLGVKLDLATALVASVALGLSVDDTFHCLLQYRRHRARKESFQESLFDSYAVSGPGVLLSSLAVALGFAVLWISNFVPFSNFGMMVGIATLGSSVGNLVLLPACLSLGNRLHNGTDIPATAVETTPSS